MIQMKVEEESPYHLMAQKRWEPHIMYILFCNNTLDVPSQKNNVLRDRLFSMEKAYILAIFRNQTYFSYLKEVSRRF